MGPTALRGIRATGDTLSNVESQFLHLTILVAAGIEPPTSWLPGQRVTTRPRLSIAKDTQSSFSVSSPAFSSVGTDTEHKDSLELFRWEKFLRSNSAGPSQGRCGGMRAFVNTRSNLAIIPPSNPLGEHGWFQRSLLTQFDTGGLAVDQTPVSLGGSPYGRFLYHVGLSSVVLTDEVGDGLDHFHGTYNLSTQHGQLITTFVVVQVHLKAATQTYSNKHTSLLPSCLCL